MRALRAVAASLLGLVLVLGMAWSAPATAGAAEPTAYVAITFTAMTPSLPDRTDPKATVTLQGTVTNTGKSELSNLQAVFWRSFDPIQDSEGMAAALASPADEPLGYRAADYYENIPSESDRTLAPKKSTDFSVTIPMSALKLPSIDAIYLLGIHIRGRLVPNGPDITLGRGRVFAPVVSGEPDNAAQLSTLVVLDSRPSLVRQGVFADDHLATELGPDGRLTALLDAAETPDASFAVDPNLIEELQTMRAGYQVLRPDGQTEAGTGQSAAGRWLADYTRMARSQSGYRLLYGHPDVSALVHAGMTSVVDNGETAAKAVTTTSALPLLAMPASGQADQQTVEYLAGLKPAAIVLDDSTTAQTKPLLAGPNGVPLLNTAATSVGGGPGPDPSDTPVQIRQRTLSESWLEAGAAGPADTIGQLRVIRTRAQARSSTSEVTAPWLKREPLSRLLDSTPASWPERYRYPESAAQKELTQTQLGGVGRLVAGYRVLADLLVRPADVELEADAAPARAASTSWRNRPDLWARFVDPQQARLDDVQHAAVTIIATPRVVTSAHRVQFPVTVRNTLPRSIDDPQRNAVQVRLRFTSANSQRLTVTIPADEQRQLQMIPADAGVTTNAQVEAQTNGTVGVTAQAYTMDGTPVGAPVPIEVKATQAGTIGWLIAIAAGIVLVGTSALRIRQVARERSRDGAAAEPPADPADGTDPTSEPHPAQTVPPPSETDRGDAPRDPESLDV